MAAGGPTAGRLHPLKGNGMNSAGTNMTPVVKTHQLTRYYRGRAQRPGEGRRVG